MLISIITINFNNAKGLLKTIESVINQTHNDFEYIVIDGGSNDGSIEIIEKYKKKISHWVSEPDNGIYNAMNKGIKLASGDYLQFLNSGDWLADKHVINKISNYLTAKIDILIGEVIYVLPNGVLRPQKNSTYVGLSSFYGGTLQHTSAFIKKSLFEEYGMYDENLKIVSDWKWYLIVAGLNKINVEFTEVCVSYFDLDGISSRDKLLDTEERKMVLEDVVPYPILADYKRYYFDVVQMQRLKRYKIIYFFVWLIERSLFKLEKMILRN